MGRNSTKQVCGVQEVPVCQEHRVPIPAGAYSSAMVRKLADKKCWDRGLCQI